MIINTSKYAKSFIFLVYNIIMIISIVSCNPPNISNTNQIVPDYDMIKIEDGHDYFKYYLRPTEYAGQLKILPETFFKSVYNCKYKVLPDFDGPYDYKTYENKFRGGLLHSHFESIADKYNTSYKAIKEQEDNYVNQFKMYYEATSKAYAAVKKYEDPAEKDNRDLNKTLKDKAIQTYLNTQMPDIPKENFPNEYFGNELRYIYENYEFHVDPTKEIYFRSYVMRKEFEISQKVDNDPGCVQLTEIEYHEVMFLNEFISATIEDQSLFTDAINRTFNVLQCTFPIESQCSFTQYIIESKNKTSINFNGYKSETKRLQNKFVVNNENEMSYLVRMKIMGYVGFDSSYHKYLYRERKDFQPDGLKSNYIDMDINTDTKLSEYSILQPLDVDNI